MKVMRTPTHIYFDFFGTLVDYEPSIHPTTANAPHDFACRAGLTLTEAHTDALWDQAWHELDGAAERSGRECSMQQIAIRFAELLEIPECAEQELTRLVDDYLEIWSTAVRPAAGIHECLEALAGDYQLSVVSNTHHPTLVQRLLARFALDSYFDEVFTSVEIGWRKPRPEIFAHVLKRHGIAASAAVFVGDNWIADVEGPRSVGMSTFYVGAPSAGRAPVSLAELPALMPACSEQY